MSDSADLLIGLKSAKQAERLAAARRIGRTGDVRVIADLRNARLSEADSWVKSALDQAISELTVDVASEESGQGWVMPAAVDEFEEVRAAAIQNVTSTLIHEIRPLVRRVALKALLEVPEYEGSQTEAAVLRLTNFLQTLERLQAASSAPVLVEFDLRDVVLRAIKDAGYGEREVNVFRSEPLTVMGDPELLCLALRNLISNAVEAGEASSAKVVINFANTDRDAWVVVLDQGRGLPSSAARIWEPGHTAKSKEDHFGWGLPIAARAVRGFNGRVSLTPREGGGTAAEIRWETAKEIP